MAGQLVGKRFHASHFLESAHHETHACCYLLANDIEMEPVPGYAARSRATLDAQLIFPGTPSAFPNGCHVAEVELDPETGVIEVVKYNTANDFGTLINPMLVAGQAHGGIVQGIGQALTETVVYDEDGQILTGSFTDYAMPRADDFPDFTFASHPVPALTNVLGAKGCGEAGCAGSLPSVMNAVADALSHFGIHHIDMPATPQRVWQAIQQAQAGS